MLSGSSSSDMFKGFFVKAFDDATGSPIGSFKAPKTIDCDGPAVSVVGAAVFLCLLKICWIIL